MALSRSQQMARIRGSDTKPELRLRRELWHRGVRYRVRPKLGFGRPDLAIPGRRIAVFVDGCFWHGCPDHYFAPRSRSAFWSNKLEENVRRDQRQLQRAREIGWRIVRVWEHDIRLDPAAAAERLIAELDSPAPMVDWRVVSVSVGPRGGNVRRLVELSSGQERTSRARPIHPPSATKTSRLRLLRQGLDARIGATQGRREQPRFSPQP